MAGPAAPWAVSRPGWTGASQTRAGRRGPLLHDPSPCRRSTAARRPPPCRPPPCRPARRQRSLARRRLSRFTKASVGCGNIVSRAGKKTELGVRTRRCCVVSRSRSSLSVRPVRRWVGLSRRKEGSEVVGRRDPRTTGAAAGNMGRWTTTTGRGRAPASSLRRPTRYCW